MIKKQKNLQNLHVYKNNENVMNRLSCQHKYELTPVSNNPLTMTESHYKNTELD